MFSHFCPTDSDRLIDSLKFILITKPEDIKSSTSRHAAASHAAKFKVRQKSRRLNEISTETVIQSFRTWRFGDSLALRRHPEYSEIYNQGEVPSYQHAIAQIESVFHDDDPSLNTKPSIQHCKYQVY